MVLASAAHGARSEEEAIKVAQSSRYNILTGNWDVALKQPAPSIAEDFKRVLPELGLHLTDEERRSDERIVLTFRGEGDQRVVVKLKEAAGSTNVRLRVGLTGSEAKSNQLFTYVYQRMG